MVMMKLCKSLGWKEMPMDLACSMIVFIFKGKRDAKIYETLSLFADFT